MNRVVLLIVALLGALPCSRANDAPPPSQELRAAFMSYVELFGKSAKQRAESGIPMRVFTDRELPEVQKRCAAIIAAAGNREDIIKAARFTITAVSYAARHPLGAGTLEIPDDQELAAILKNKSGVITEMRVDGACFVALLRLAKLFGPVDTTEDAIMKGPEILSIKPLPGNSQAPGDKDKPARELTLAIASDGTVSIDRAAVADKDLTETLRHHLKKAETDGKRLVVTITGGKTTKAARIQSVMNHCNAAGIKNVSFQSATQPER